MNIVLVFRIYVLLVVACAPIRGYAQGSADLRCPEAIIPGQPVAAEKREIGGIERSLEWNYYGDVIPIESIDESIEKQMRTIKQDLRYATYRFCIDGYCAHGIGDLSTDGSWWYFGEFRYGYIHGYGEYTNDFYDYNGCYSFGKMHGPGHLRANYYDCPPLDGEFVNGAFEGEPIGWNGPCGPFTE